LLLFRAWERLLEIEFLDRSIALAGKAFVSFFPLIIVVAAFLPEGVRTSIITAVTVRLGVRGDALVTFKEAFASSDDVRAATGVLGLFFTCFFATSFTTALQRVYLRTWRRPPVKGPGAYWRGLVALSAVLLLMAVLGSLGDDLDNGLSIGLFAVLAVAATSALWWFIPWFLLVGEVRPRVLAPTAILTSVTTIVFALSAAIWMPDLVTENEEQFGIFGIALALVSWFSGAAMCILVSACAGVVLAEDSGGLGRFIRGGDSSTLNPGARPPLPPPARELTLRDAFSTEGDS
jgi:membrane protein